MSLLVISCSLNPDSRSRLMARHAVQSLAEHAVSVDLLDLQETPLPMCDGSAVYDDPRTHAVTEQIAAADGLIVAAPVYNFDVNAAAKNLLELTHRAWEEQVVGFLLAAGGNSSYMSVMSFANSLMLDYRCLILPKFVYATREAFDGETVTDPQVTDRIDELATTLVSVSKALKTSPSP